MSGQFKETRTCRVCGGEGHVPTGRYHDPPQAFIPDGGTKACPGCGPLLDHPRQRGEGPAGAGEKDDE